MTGKKNRTNRSKPLRNHKAKQKKNDRHPDTHSELPTLGDDYWERIAEDPAHGYKNG